MIEEKQIENVEDRLSYTNQLQDQAHKLRTQLSLGFDGNGETNVLLMMLIKPIREPLMPEIERIKKEYEKKLNEEAGRILIKFGVRIVQDGRPKLSTSEMFKKIAEENKLYRQGILQPEKLTPNMFTWNSTARREYDVAKFKADNFVNGHILQLVLDRLFECNLLLNFGSSMETPNVKTGSEQL